MPHIAITMIPGRDETAKLALAKKVQAFIAAELMISPKFVSVSVEDVPMADWEQSMKQFPQEILFVKPGTDIDKGSKE